MKLLAQYLGFTKLIAYTRVPGAAAGRRVGYSDDHVCLLCVCVCVCVCPCALISQQPYAQTSPTSVAVARSSSDVRAVCYILPVLYVTSCFPIVDPTAARRHRSNVAATLYMPTSWLPPVLDDGRRQD